MLIATSLSLVKALGKGDPLSPLLFNLVVDVFIRMLIKVANKSYITRLINTLSQKVLSTFSMLMTHFCS
jgi:hypothetical protein